MKAIRCSQLGPPDSLTLDDIEPPLAGPGEVVIAVKAAGVNFPDVLIIQGKYQIKPALPFTPGYEVAGIVTAVGDGVTHLKAGDHAVAQTALGGFAEQVKVPAQLCFAMPPSIPFVDAAAFPIAYGTSYYALKDRARLQPGETLLVLGASGGVGLAAVQLGKIMGARVIACASSEEKLAACKAHGADALVNYASEDLREAIKRLCAGKGVDVALDPVGGAYSEPCVRGMAWKGRYLVVGFAAGEIPRIPLNLALLKGCAIVGVACIEPAGSPVNFRQLIAWVADGTLKPVISATYPLARAADALKDMLNRRVQGKAVIVP